MAAGPKTIHERMILKVALGADHAGFHLKTSVAKHLIGAGHEIIDLGTDSEEPVDYPAYCAAVARAVASGSADRGVVIGGSGQGEQIAANKVHGVRAALCHDEYTARYARLHNDANVLSLGGRLLGETLALVVLDTFLQTDFEGGRHARRIAQIAEIEEEECRKNE
ncbi:MAG: ribose 5-phosphate isomerase B [Actinomycetota bacterium]|nr:ribose 5-phosphate isomerase B [Actinomycetota bacterium]